MVLIGNKWKPPIILCWKQGSSESCRDPKKKVIDLRFQDEETRELDPHGKIEILKTKE